MDVLEGDDLDGDELGGEGLVAAQGAQPVGLITWRADRSSSEAEVRALAVAGEARGRGIGRALLEAAEEALRAAGARRAWLVTTNDNLAALALYQKAGWRLVALHPGEVDELRRSVKPTIPAIGQHGIPIRDELELAKDL
jgi:ribosomal protein S18 acetylase RimI-like enzyme